MKYTIERIRPTGCEHWQIGAEVKVAKTLAELPQLWLGVPIIKPISFAPIFRKYKNGGYLLFIAAMFDKCRHSCAVETLVKYEYAWNERIDTVVK